jgi:hypothetical protein
MDQPSLVLQPATHHEKPGEALTENKLSARIDFDQTGISCSVRTGIGCAGVAAALFCLLGIFWHSFSLLIYIFLTLLE